MKDSVKIFENAQFGQLRTSVTEGGEPLFCLTDLCKAIGVSNSRNVTKRLEKGDVYLVDTPTYNQYGAQVNQSVTFVSEPGMYEVVLRSDSAKAKPFRKWVCGEVLPSIRKSGGYMVAKADETPEQIMARALMVAKDTIERQQSRIVEAESKNRALQNENSSLAKMNEAKDDTIKQMQPQVTFAKAVETSNRSILVGELARIIKQNGVEIGQNRLFVWMRKNGYLLTKGELYNQPSQKAMDKGLFEIKKTIISNPSGEQIVTTTTKVTGKGQLYFVNKFLGETAMCEKGGRA